MRALRSRARVVEARIAAGHQLPPLAAGRRARLDLTRRDAKCRPTSLEPGRVAGRVHQRRLRAGRRGGIRSPPPHLRNMRPKKKPPLPGMRLPRRREGESEIATMPDQEVVSHRRKGRYDFERIGEKARGGKNSLAGEEATVRDADYLAPTSMPRGTELRTNCFSDGSVAIWFKTVARQRPRISMPNNFPRLS